MKIRILDKYDNNTMVELHNITDFKDFMNSINWDYPILVFNDVAIMTREVVKVEVVKE